MWSTSGTKTSLLFITRVVTIVATVLKQLSGWPQVWVKKIQELFKDIEVRFQDLFQCRFTAMWGYKK